MLNIEFKPQVPGSYIAFDLSLLLRQEVAGRSELVSSAGIFYAPSHHFAGNTRLAALGHSFQVPQDYEDFLTFMYGNWREPQQNMSLNSYDNRNVITDIDPRSVKIKKYNIYPTGN